MKFHVIGKGRKIFRPWNTSEHDQPRDLGGGPSKCASCSVAKDKEETTSIIQHTSQSAGKLPQVSIASVSCPPGKSAFRLGQIYKVQFYFLVTFLARQIKVGAQTSQG